MKFGSGVYVKSGTVVYREIKTGVREIKTIVYRETDSGEYIKSKTGVYKGLNGERDRCPYQD